MVMFVRKAPHGAFLLRERGCIIGSMESVIEIVFHIAILLFSVVLHEVSHGYAALMLGDRTAQHAGRLTLNPIPHIDPFGSLLLPLASFYLGGIIIGWAKPVPYNPYFLRNQKWGPALVGAAGPLANIALAVFFALIIRATPLWGTAVSGAVAINFLAIAGSIVFINLILALFNLVPIPPLDGSKLLFSLLPHEWKPLELFLHQYGFFVLLFFIFFFSNWIAPIAFLLFRLLTGSAPLL